MKRRINRARQRKNIMILGMIVTFLIFGVIYLSVMIPRWVFDNKMKDHRMIVLSQHFMHNIPDYLRYPWTRNDFDHGDVILYGHGQFGILLDGHQSRLTEVLNLEYREMEKGLYPNFRYAVVEGTEWSDLLDILPKRTFKAEHFGIKEVTTAFDYNNDGLNDAQNFVIGAREGAYSMITYVDKYYWNSYPPAGEGVCTDVIWMAYREAGYTLRRMLNKDIVENTELYWRTRGEPDMAIDFRRVVNVEIYLRRKAISLTTDLSDIEQWQPGDIVVFDGHIGIVSDKRDRYGVPLMIHHGGGPGREESAMHRQPILGHYRFDASLLDAEDLILWQ